MANEIRLRRNNMFGTITDNPLTNGATTINSPGFVDLPTVDATNHLILILDPTETNGAAEIVRVTAHTAASSVVTVIRGVESSSPRQHPLGTTWFFGPVTSDFEEILTSSTRPSVPYTGEAIFETDTARVQRYSGTIWQQDNLYFDPPACRAKASALTTCTNGSETAIALAAEDYDTDTMHDTVTNNSRVTIKTAGIYVVTGLIPFDAAASGRRQAFIRLNGTSFYLAMNVENATSLATYLTLATTYKFAVNDYIELRAFVDGANVNTIQDAAFFSFLSATWIGRGN